MGAINGGLSEKVWGKMYTAVGGFTAVFAWLAASNARGVVAKDEGVTNLGAYGPFLSALFGFLWLWGLTCVVLIVVLRYATAVRATSWSERLPVPFFDEGDVDRRSANGRWLQALVAFGFVVIPTLCLFAVFATFMSTKFYAVDGVAQIDGWSQLSSPKFWPGTFSSAFRFGSATGLTYFPVLQPGLYCLMYAGHLILLLVALYRIARGGRRLPGGS